MTAAFWDRVARKYAASPIGNMPAYEATLERVASYLTPTDRVLELGCGTGSTAIRLAPHVKQYIATDGSPCMIEIAREKDAPDTLEFRISGASDPQPDAPFDAITAFSLLHLVPDLNAVVRAMHASLKPGGLAITKTPCVGEMILPIRLALPVMRLLGKAPDVLVFKRDRLERAFTENGFEIVEHGQFLDAKRNRFIVARKA